MFWGIIMLLVFAACAGSAFYTGRGISRFGFMRRLVKAPKARLIVSIGVVLASACALYIALGVMNAAVCLIHLTLFWMLSDGIGRLLRKRFKPKTYISGYFAVIVTVIYLLWGAYNVYHVDVTRYSFTTDKTDKGLRIALIADSHMGTTFDAKGFEKELRRIEEYEPDVLLITGDFVDDDTELPDMLGACEALSRFSARYGVYYVFGNHDKGYYASKRGYSGAELKAALESNGVTVLEDAVTELPDGYVIVGRQDYSARSRADISALAEAYKDKYTIVMDHQPHDYDNEAQSGVDLVLSGHTHGGQLIPINYVGMLIGENDSRYGYSRRGNTDFIVTSGISNWALAFKTGCKSEFVIIDINGGN